MICSLHSFNGVVVPSFSLRIVCEPRALATASTGGLSAEGTGRGKPSPLGTVPNGAPEVTRSPFENTGLRFQKATSLGEGKGPKRGARRMATEVGAAGRGRRAEALGSGRREWSPVRAQDSKARAEALG